MNIRNVYRRYTMASLITILISLLFASALADSGITIPTREEARKVNENKVGVVFTHEELFHQLVHNMEDELEHDSGLRIVPIMGKNHVQSVYDLLYLNGVDLALVRADAIEYIKRKGGYSSIQNFVDNVAKVSEEKIVIIARNDYQSMEDLEGQVVGFGLPGSGEYVTSTIAFDVMDVEPDYIEVNNTIAIEKLKSGELAAMVYLLRAADAVQTGDDLRAANAIKNLDLGPDLHIMNILESDELSKIYTPSTLTSSDLPGVIDDGVTISTYSVDAILAVYRWKQPSFRFDQTQRFVNALVDGLEGLRSEVYQPAWQRVDLEYQTPNVTSSSLVQAALDFKLAEEERLRELERIAVEKAAAEEERLRELERIAVEKAAAEEERLLELERIAVEKAAAEAEAAKLAELIEKRDALTARIGDELNEADADELERMLNVLNTFLQEQDEQVVRGPK